MSMIYHKHIFHYNKLCTSYSELVIGWERERERDAEGEKGRENVFFKFSMYIEMLSLCTACRV